MYLIRFCEVRQRGLGAWRWRTNRTRPSQPPSPYGTSLSSPRAPRRRPGARGRSGVRTVRRTTALLIIAALVATGGATVPEPSSPGWASRAHRRGRLAVHRRPALPEQAEGASYLPDSSAIRLADGRIRLIPSGGDTPVTVDASDPQVDTAVRSDNLWLSQGTIPTGGKGQTYRDMAARALLDLRLLTRPNGASLASWYTKWRYCWPRDSAFTVAAFTVTGHPSEARRVLRFLARAQSDNGMWAARYNADGTAVADGRQPQLDSLGWVLWAAWFYRVQTGPPDELPDLWPMVTRAADHLARSLDAEGCRPPRPTTGSATPPRAGPAAPHPRRRRPRPRGPGRGPRAAAR